MSRQRITRLVEARSLEEMEVGSGWLATQLPGVRAPR
jgi:hypothetical protein